ncbi:MAG: hypothetical protein ETSY2_49820 [Candidatus Entotheonella gemina]|uniref:Uncharacterized protein n=1 Tax=Candidatus Entotheonella gemina TaxID=1429439 RepID=W4L970_9BACT|nr:MAG: hypothetical protein ETSY2_49820 [Candidatus Entotheonella gemina]
MPGSPKGKAGPTLESRLEFLYASLGQDIERLKTIPLNPPTAKEYIFAIFRKKVIPMRLFHPVVDEWNKMAVTGYGSQWQLHNAFTEHIKHLSPAVAFNATRKVGQFFQM